MDISNLLYITIIFIIGLSLFLLPKSATYLLIILCVFQLGWFTRYFDFTSYLDRISYFVSMFLGFRIVIDFMIRKIVVRKNEKISISILLFVFMLLILNLWSNTYNQESVKLGLYEQRYYLMMIILFFSIYHYSVLDLSLDVFIKMLVCIGLLQIPFAIIQFVLAGGGADRTLDSVTGTFSNYGSLVFSVISGIGLLLNYKLEAKKDLFGLNTYFLIFLLIIPLLLSKSRTGTGLVVFMIVFVFMRVLTSKKPIINHIKAFVLMSSLTLVASLLFYNFFWKPNYDVKTQLSFDYVISYFMREPHIKKTGETASMGRARALVEASKLVLEKPTTALIGLGGGSVSEMRFLGASGRYYFESGSLVGVGRTQASKIIAENGILGISLFLFLFYSIWRNIKRTKIGKSVFKSSYIIILISVVLLSLYMTVLQNLFIVLVVSYYFALIQHQLKMKPESHSNEKTYHHQPGTVRVSY